MKTNSFLAFSALILGMVVSAPSFGSDKPGPSKVLFAKSNWYKNTKAKEQAFEGVLRKVTPGKKDQVHIEEEGRWNPVRLIMANKRVREVYLGSKLSILDEYLGQRVRILGKPIQMSVEGRDHAEIWPAKIEALAAKEGNQKGGK